MIAALIAGIEDLNDREFITELFYRYSRLMFSIAGDFVSDTYEKEDIVQDAIVRLISKVGTLRELNERALVSYIVVTVKHTAINHLRKLQHDNQNTSFIFEDDDAPDIPDDALSVADTVILNEDIGSLSRIWPKLKESERFILEGKYIGGYSDKELAEAIGCREGSIRMMLTRARRHALNELQKAGVEIV